MGEHHGAPWTSSRSRQRLLKNHTGLLSPLPGREISPLGLTFFYFPFIVSSLPIFTSALNCGFPPGSCALFSLRFLYPGCSSLPRLFPTSRYSRLHRHSFNRAAWKFRSVLFFWDFWLQRSFSAWLYCIRSSSSIFRDSSSPHHNIVSTLRLSRPNLAYIFRRNFGLRGNNFCFPRA